MPFSTVVSHRSGSFVFALAFLTLAFAGCNVLEGFNSTTGDPQALLEEARIALDQGDPDEAVDLLRRAMEKDSDDPAIRTTLSTALLAQHGVDAMDFTRLAKKTNDEEKAGTAFHAKEESATCSFPSTHTHASFDPTDLDSFDKIEDSRDALREVQDLLHEVLGGAASSASLEEAVVRLQEELDKTLVADALLNAAIAHVALAYVEIARSGGDALSFYHVTSPEGHSYIGYCAPDQETLDSALEAVACRLVDLNYGRLLLGTRAGLLGSSRAQELSERADEAYEVLARELDAVCSADA